MKNPFPGMDPYLEQYWGDVHTSFATYAKDHLQEQLPLDLIANVEEDIAATARFGRPETWNADIIHRNEGRTMKNPFPGMDPYLEQYWGDVHTKFAAYATDYLQEQLPLDLIANVEEDIAIQSKQAGEHATFFPDIRVEEIPSGAAAEPASSSAAAIADTIEVPIESEPMTQRSIRIVEPESGNRIVTAIEILSPSNKIGAKGRKAFSRKRALLLEGGVSLVEIDLIRDGRPNLAVAAKALPVEYRQPYRICVVRAWRNNVAQLYSVPLRRRLPDVSIPLRESDKEVTLDLQAIIDMVYKNGRYCLRSYRGDPWPPLEGSDAAWAGQLLREKGLRK